MGSKEIAHGTQKGYSDGCRCDFCRTAWATYIRARRHRTGTARPRAAQLVAREIAQAEAVAQAEPSADPSGTLRLTPLGWRILAELQRRTNERRGEIVDRLLREHGATSAA